MTSISAKNKTLGAGHLTGTDTDGALGQQENGERPISGTALSAKAPALALHMGLPGTRLEMVLGGPHPLLVHLIRAMARTAAQADHAVELAHSTDEPAYRTED